MADENAKDIAKKVKAVIAAQSDVAKIMKPSRLTTGERGMFINAVEGEIDGAKMSLKSQFDKIEETLKALAEDPTQKNQIEALDTATRNAAKITQQVVDKANAELGKDKNASPAKFHPDAGRDVLKTLGDVRKKVGLSELEKPKVVDPKVQFLKEVKDKIETVATMEVSISDDNTRAENTIIEDANKLLKRISENEGLNPDDKKNYFLKNNAFKQGVVGLRNNVRDLDKIVNEPKNEALFPEEFRTQVTGLKEQLDKNQDIDKLDTKAKAPKTNRNRLNDKKNKRSAVEPQEIPGSSGESNEAAYSPLTSGVMEKIASTMGTMIERAKSAGISAPQPDTLVAQQNRGSGPTPQGKGNTPNKGPILTA